MRIVCLLVALGEAGCGASALSGMWEGFHPFPDLSIVSCFLAEKLKLTPGSLSTEMEMSSTLK